MSEVVLSARGVGRTFTVRNGGRTEHLRAVSEVDIELRRRRTLGVVGESGCGKTTLNRLLLLLDTPTEGEISFRGKPAASLSAGERRAFRRAIQPVFQNPFSSLDPRMRVGAIIAEPLHATGMSRGEVAARVGEVLTAVGLRAEDARRYPNEFSGGQRQRIAIARAIAPKPELIMLDEPVSSQDISIRAQILNLIKDLQDEYGLGCVFISHDLATVRFMAHEVVVMYLGRIIERGPAEEICTRPSHPYTRALLAASLPPDPDAPQPELPPQGEIPSPLAPPPGCAYHTRCPLAMEVCRTTRPPAVVTGPGASVACHLFSPEPGDAR